MVSHNDHGRTTSSTPSGSFCEVRNLDDDGDVDLQDLAIMLSALGTVCS